MRMPPNEKAKYVVEHYLDSVNKPVKVELVEFIKIEKTDIDNSEIIKRINSDPNKSDSEKQHNRKWLNSINDVDIPNGFYCDYRISGIKHVSIIRLDNMLSKVVRFTEMHD